MIALVATALANVVNNLPATLLLVPLVAPLGVTAVMAALIGLGVGSGLTYTGSLANLLWRRTLRRPGMTRPRAPSTCSRPSSRSRPSWSAVVLWAWAPLVRLICARGGARSRARQDDRGPPPRNA